MVEKSIDTLFSPSTTPPWMTRAHLMEAHSPPSEPLLECPTLLLASRSPPPVLRTFKERLASLPRDLRDLFEEPYLDVTSKCNEDLTTNPMHIAAKKAISNNGATQPLIERSKPLINPYSGPKPGSSLRPEKSKKSIPINELSIIPLSNASLGTFNVPCYRSRESVVSGFTDRQDLASLILFSPHFQTPTLRIHRNGSVVIRGKIQSGLMTSTLPRRHGSLDSSKYGPIGTPSPHKSREAQWSSAPNESSSHRITESMKWDSPILTSQP